ncbi:unnamed protein product [Acanthosepion pharaonis]|uniref:Uncharacterized protein n=1 Tax=Acanthosepion pharaonis TaxID=158019 RepID=A0A812BPM8_ACAPH|nr:unnamed protein product [Sepia pharaonis]
MMANPRPIEEDKQHELMKDVDGEASCSKSQLPLGRNASSSSCLPSQLRLSDSLAVNVNPEPSASSHHSSSPGIVLHREQATSYLYDCFSGPILGPPDQTGLSSMVKGDNTESMKVVEVDTSRGHNFHSDERPLAKPSSSNNTYNLKVCPSPITSESSYNFFQMAMYPEKVINIEEFLGVSDILITGNDDAGKKKKMSNIVPTIPTDNNSGSSCSNAIDPSGSSSLSSGVSMNLNSMVGPSTSGRFASVLNLSCYNENLDNYLKTGNNECMSSMNEASMASGAAGRNSENVVNLSQHVACPSGSSVTKVVVTSAVVDRPGSSNVVNPNGIIASTGVHHAAGSNHKAVVVNVPNLGAENGIRGVENGGQKIHNEQIPNQAENDLEMEFYESVIELENEYNGNNAREGRETNLSSSLPLSNGNNLDTSATTVANGGTALSGSPAAEGTNGMAGAATPTASDILKCTICTKTFNSFFSFSIFSSSPHTCLHLVQQGYTFFIFLFSLLLDSLNL